MLAHWLTLPLALAAGTWLQACAPRPPADGTRQLTRQTVLLDVEQAVSVTSDGSMIAAVTGAGEAVFIDVARGQIQNLHRDATAVAVMDRSGGLAYGDKRGRIFFAPDSGSPFEEIAHPAGQPIDGLSLGHGLVAWSCSRAQRGGVLDARTGEELARLDRLAAPFHPGWRGARVVLLGSEGLVLARRRGRPLRLHRLEPLEGADGFELVPVGAALAGYPATVDPSRAATDAHLHLARPSAGRACSLERIDLRTGERALTLTSLRRGALVHLLPSPDGRFVLEGDPLQPGVELHRMTSEAVQAQPATQLLFETADAQRALPLGFAAVGDVPHAITTGPEGQDSWAWPLKGRLEPIRWAFGNQWRPVRAGALSGAWVWALVRREDGSLDLVVRESPGP